MAETTMIVCDGGCGRETEKGGSLARDYVHVHLTFWKREFLTVQKLDFCPECARGATIHSLLEDSQ